MRVVNLASGSKGNCTLIENDEAIILIDCGLSVREVLKRISLVGADKSKIKAIFVTHIHTDHISGVGDLSKKLGLKVFATKENYLEGKLKVEAVYQNIIVPNQKVKFCGFELTPFVLSHDAVSTVGYLICTDGRKVAIATDTGEVTIDMYKNLCGVDLALLESNHDEQMLLMGKYPPALKKRVHSKLGHLSNVQCSELIVKLIDLGTKHFMLMHLSENNNTPELAYSTAVSYIEYYYGDALSANVYLSHQDKPSKNFILKKM